MPTIIAPSFAEAIIPITVIIARKEIPLSVQQSPTKDGPALSPARAVELIDKWFAVRGVRPSGGLRALFEQVGRLAGEYSSDRHEISSRFLFFAAAEANPGAQYDASEGNALKALQPLFDRDSEPYRMLRNQYFVRAKGASGSRQPALTANVERLLGSAIASAKPRQAGLVTVTDLLLAYPPKGSKGEGLMAELRIDPHRWRETIMAAAAAATQPSGEDSLSDSTQAEDDSASPPSQDDAPAEGDAGSDSTAAAATTAAATATTTSEPVFNDSVATHADEPALIDQLERAPFAACLAQNIRQARASGETDASAFIVHLHGPWGSGKSSVLNFLEAELEARLDSSKEAWLVVRFNAWRDQRRQPPWWSLITCIYAGARDNPDKETSRRLWWRWFKWRVRADFMPWAVAGALALLCVILLILGVTSSIGPTVSAILGAISLVGAGAVAARSLALGSQRAAQTYAELKTDPFQPITDLFDCLIRDVKRPVAVFIDDLDRCDCDYVVELLEGIQTLMRSAPVTYVVAADRKWICSSFEQKYAKFSPPIGEPGRPLGYLFLDKIFQVSAAVPQLASDIREAYWKSLLIQKRDEVEEEQTPAEKAEADQAKEEKAREEKAKAEKAKADIAGLSTHEQLRAAVAQAKKTKDPVIIQTTRAEAALRITSAEASADAQHRLEGYAKFLEPNPRSMKRLVNAYGMHQATLFLAGRFAYPNALARWTILELRWPLLADFLAVRPAYVDRLRPPFLAETDVRHVPERLRDLFGDELVAAVAGSDAGEDRLDAEAVLSILGAVQGDR
jgi:hypothetical protein